MGAGGNAPECCVTEGVIFAVDGTKADTVAVVSGGYPPLVLLCVFAFSVIRETSFSFWVVTDGGIVVSTIVPCWPM